MTAPALALRPQGRRMPLLLLAMIVLLAIVVAAIFLTPSGLAGAWLIAWLFLIGFPAGSLVLLLAHGLTGGDWGFVARPFLAAMALTMPLLAVAFLPIALSLPDIYVWAGHAGAVRHEGVAEVYLNSPAFLLRSVVILVLWSALAVLAALVPLGPVISGLGILAYGLSISFGSVDWLMSLDPKWFSTAYPALLGISQVGSALALLSVLRGVFGQEARNGDFAGLLIAAILGVTYLAFIQYLVMWSGNLPEKVGWYVGRLTPSATALVSTTFIVGSVLPFSMLLFSAVRKSARWTGLAGLFCLVGLYLHLTWLVGLAPAAAWLALLLTIVLGGAWLAIVVSLLGARHEGEGRHA
ncbi:hypothetical protein [Afifella marina]|uniref:Quinol:cytochrome c oxidoreductase quinone-binding subunit 2 n=1 Tax=Afifella marina DSM 2698 TaxID=1120955 RepID=A0A1G5MTU0_AFIMA|nr:hypothetical protein [Afifella marina]MBK1621973.1 hypothetical protein [Afifella marina DSM 2698]MBK1627766.1 hypothetical protein [Afifella marina]MBK5916733.1 hypothetical protein [Afifella marina]RAI19940.1 hypothetical protein CH311_11565 [Afifella marina DSM 2698]SCZ28585.1 hypothetical protein SAMN03080610_01001 [Afifella marina DSM 2698]